ncbi:AMP-binding protein [Chitinimonas arctica]|uniref:AMP-binding protein n=1 Tax=Chitinimonas arctica TaxID=2594795 RepID=A0A516SKQ4_9NEIS|nr:AMP-binding protein [Chitinimonas arctica]QDQ28736.1 AMP-binding protein [Chitinimonas arctica]
MSMQRFELSRSQQAVFTMQAFQLAGQHFYLGGVARLRGKLALAELVRATRLTQDGHELFRIGFVADADSGLWYGVRHAQPQAEIGQVDFSDHADPEAAFEGWAERQLLLEEDLALQPVRVFVVRFGKEELGWFVKAHHAASDGATLALVMSHFSQALESGRCDASPAFSLLADCERDYEAGSRHVRDADYWRSLFGEAADHAAPAVQARAPIGDYRKESPRSMRVRATLAPADNAILRRFSEAGGSVFRLFFAAVGFCQMVVEDSDGVLLQAPMLNRWSDAEKATLAMAVAPVLVPVSRAAGETAAACYHRLKKTLQKAVVHSRFAPGARWGEFASPAWRQAIPAFGVSYQTGAFDRRVAGVEVDIDHLQAVEALFATIHIHDRFDGGSFRLEADFRRRWSAAECQAFLQAVLDQAVSVARDVLGEADPAGQDADEADVAPIGVALQAAFERYGDQCLFKYGGREGSLGYRDGWAWMSRFRASLRQRGYPDGCNAPVLILGRRLPETTLAYLACLIDNITVVPVCPTTPPARLQAILRSAGAGLCVHAAADRQLAESLGLPLLEVSLALPSELAAVTAPAAATASRPAYILYTSGSTGEPKGVAISPTALAHYALAATAAYAGERPFSTPLFTSFGFDLTQTSLLVPVLSGGFIQTWEHDLRDDPGMLQALLADEALTGVKCTPSHLSLLTEHSLPRRNPLTFVVGGENLLASLVDKSLTVFPPGSRIVNEYGPTETTVGCCIHTVSQPAAEGLAAGTITPIGVALGTARMSIRDSLGQPLPLGFRGEIWIGGPVLADGYVGNPDQTAARFVAGPDGHGRWYRTGDLGLLDAAGVFHCLGRIDDEFKLRGHRIHPAEIEKAVEAALARVDKRRCELKALKLALGGTDCIVLCSNEPLPASHPEFMASLHAALPEAWRPAHFCAVQPWPVNANGKVDAAALQATVTARLAVSDADAAVAAPAGRPNWQLPDWLNEAFLRPIWPSRVDWHASFLEQGGDSIKAIRLAALLARHGVRIGAAELLTARALGAVLEAACSTAATASAAAPEVAADSIEADWIAALPASRWFHRQPLHHRDRLQQGVVLALPEGQGAGQIHAAVEAVKARHGVFALRGDPAGGEYRLAGSAQALREYALAPGETLEQRLLALQAEVTMQQQASVHEVVTDAGQCYLLWVCHHLLCDVHSWVHLLDELDEWLAAPIAGSSPVRAEYGAFLWGQWLQAQPAWSVPVAAAAVALPAGEMASLALSLPKSSLQQLAHRLKAERAELIAAALLDLMREDGSLPPQPVVLLENAGRVFDEAGVPASWRRSLDAAVGWFTGFERIAVPVGTGGGLLHDLKAGRHAAGRQWFDRLGPGHDGATPLLCLNDIGHGLAGQTDWRHFRLDPTLSGGYRHPAEAAGAHYDLLLQDDPSGLVSIQLTVAGAGREQAGHSLRRLDARLLALHAALQQEQPDRLGRQALLPADFPFCQLTQPELDLILDGATV